MDLAADPQVQVALNGNYFDYAGLPTGLVATRGQQLAPYRRGGGSGLLLVGRERAELRASPRTAPSLSPYELMIQCGPRLVEPGGKVGIRSDDGRRAARTAVCLRDHGRTLDLVVTWDVANPASGPGLLELARWLASPDAGPGGSCESALNLDGGPSTGLIVAGAPELNRAALGPVVVALVAKSTTARSP